MPFSLFPFPFWQNGRKITALRAQKQYVRKRQFCITKAKTPKGLGLKTTMRRNSVFRLLFAEVDDNSTYQRNIILSEYSNNRNEFIRKAGAIFVQPVWASMSSLTDSICFYILTKWGSLLDNNIPMRTHRSSVKTYLASMKIGATIIEFTRTFVIFFIFIAKIYLIVL